MEKRVQELRAGLEAPPLERVPLGREVIPGNAWDDYLVAVPDGDAVVAEVSLNHLLYGRDGGEEAKPLIEKNAADIDLIRRAAHRQICKAPPARVDDGFTLIGDDSLSAVRRGAALTLAKAHLLADRGHGKQALEMALDVYLCGRDLAGTRTGRSSGKGIKIMGGALAEMTNILKSQKLEQALLQKLEVQFSLLDRHTLDNSAVLLDNLMEIGESLLQPEHRNAWLGDKDSDYSRQRWRYFFSPRLKAATDFARADSMVQQALNLERSPWSSAEPIVQALFNESDTNMLLRFATHNLHDSQSSRGLRTGLRMCAMAAHYLATGEVMIADSEYGGKIRTQRAKDVLLIWAPVEPGPEEPPSLEDFKGYGGSLIAVPLRR
jgi:hypothetical protein